MRKIRTERLDLVPVRSTNADVLWRLMQSEDLRVYQDLPRMERSQFISLIASRKTRFGPRTPGRFEWLLYPFDVAQPAGWVSLRVGERTTSIGEIGYSLVSLYRGRGLATEAVRALIDEAFSRGCLARLRAYCIPENSASREVLRRLGFVENGILPHGASLRGRAVDVVSYVLEAPTPPK